MKAAIYARYSSNLQREDSIIAQVRACTEYCNRKGYSVVIEYVDEAFSAKNDDRPAFQEMIRAGKAKLFDILIVHKVDRFARNRYDAAYYKRELKKAGIGIQYVEQNIDGSPESVILESVLEGMAEYYSLNLAREVMKNLKENAYKAKFNGGIPPLGYDIVDGNYIINEREAEAVRLIFQMYLEGYGYIVICKKLNKNHRTKLGNEFGRNSIHEILKNPRYMGTYVYNKVKRDEDGSRNSHSQSDEIIVVENAIPAIIDRKDFEKVQKKMEKNKKRAGAYTARETYLLSGLVYCECGSAITARTTTSRGEKHHYYYCSARERGGKKCDNPMIRRDPLEDYVVEQIERRMFSTDRISEFVDEVNANINKASEHIDKELKLAHKQKNEALRKMENLYRLVEDGQIDEFTRQRINKVREEVDRISTYIRELELKAQRQLLTREQVLELMIRYQHIIKRKDPDGLRVLLNTFVDKILVTKDKVDLTLKVLCGHDGAEGGI